MRRLLALLCAAALAGCSVEADFSDVLETETLVAEEYQQEIAAIDRLLFRETPLGQDGVAELARILTDLSKRVGTRSDSKFLKIESLELLRMAKHAARLSPRGTGRALQSDWMRIRNNLFDDRAWFVRSAADLEYAASVVPPPTPVQTPIPPPRTTTPVTETLRFENRDTLNGRWQATSMTANGKPSDDTELIGSIWTFDRPRLVIREARGEETSYSFSIRDGYLALTTAAGQEGWMKYELEGGALRLAFFDGLRGKPESFEPVPGRSDPLLVVVRLVALQ